MDIKINLVGNFKSDISDFIDKQDLDLTSVYVDITERYFETDVFIKAPESYRDEFDEIVRLISVSFKSYIYGINEQNIYTAVFDLLKYNNLKLGIAESVSGGRLASEFVSHNDGASSVLIESIVCYTRASKEYRLDIEPNYFDKYSTESVEASFELANGILRTSDADVVVATTGYTDNCSPDDVGKCFIAVGDRENIHIFKHKFEGNRNKIMQQISKMSFLHLLKNVKENLYNFEESVL